MTDFGYTRISKPKQSIERQIRNIKSEYPNAVIIQEVWTRTRFDRKEWRKLMKIIKPGDRIIFDSVSRMSGNAEDGFAEYERLYNMGITLIFLKEPHINTETYKKALENNVQLTGSNVDYILEGVNRYLIELAREQIPPLSSPKRRSRISTKGPRKVLKLLVLTASRLGADPAPQSPPKRVWTRSSLS